MTRLPSPSRPSHPLPTQRPLLRLTRIAAALRPALLLGVALGVAAIVAPAMALAQATQVSEPRRSYAIPAGTLDQVLNRFAGASSLELSVDAALTRDKTSPGLNGSFTVQEGFAELLRGQGLQAVRGVSGAHSLRAVPQPEQAGSAAEATLPAIKAVARAEQESATGPVHSYVAKRSATATKTDTPLLDTPRSVSVITREQIEAQMPITMQDALGYTPGIYAPPLAASSTDSTSGVAIRGFRTLDGDAYYQDGMRAKFSGWWGYSGYEPYAFERIEVLRGPASVLYGQGQPNGTINLVSKRPTQTPLREVGVEFGSFDLKQFTTDLAGPLDTDGQWSYRLTALARDSSTQIDHSENNRQFISAALAWRPSARTELILRAGYQRNEGESNNNRPMVGTLLPNPNGVIPRNRAIANDNSAHFDSKNIAWQFEHHADDVWTLRSNMRLNQQTGSRQGVRNGGYQAGQERIINRNISNYWSMDGNYNLTTDNQAQARFNLGTAEHTVLVGVDFARQKDGWQNSGGTALPLDVFDPVYTPVIFNKTPNYERTANDQQLGLYAQDQIKIDKRLVISVGGRKDWAKSWEHSGTPGANESGSVQKDNAFTWQTGVAYLFDGGVTPYASYAESFVPTLGTNFFGAALMPETGRQYEAGVKFQPNGSSLLLTAAVFDIRRQNVTTSDPAEPLNRIQTGEVSSHGVELEARSEIVKGLNLIGGYAYTRAKVSKSNDDDVGKELIQSPRNSAALWMDYGFSDTALAGLSVGAGLRYIGSTWADTSNTISVPGFTLLDLSLRYDLGRASTSLKGAQVYLNVKNLTDKTYMTCFYSNCLYGLERSTTAGIRYNW